MSEVLKTEDHRHLFPMKNEILKKIEKKLNMTKGSQDEKFLLERMEIMKDRFIFLILFPVFHKKMYKRYWCEKISSYFIRFFKIIMIAMCLTIVFFPIFALPVKEHNYCYQVFRTV